MAPRPERFSIAVGDHVLEDLDNRLARIRWPDDPGNEDWRYGTNRAWLEGLVEFWRHGYDWRVHEAAMNRFEHLVHTRRREEGEPSVERINHSWVESQAELFGDSVEITESKSLIAAAGRPRWTLDE